MIDGFMKTKATLILERDGKVLSTTTLETDSENLGQLIKSLLMKRARERPKPEKKRRKLW